MKLEKCSIPLIPLCIKPKHIFNEVSQEIGSIYFEYETI